MSWAFKDAARLFEIIGVNLLLSGDNAIIVAMAIRHLPRPRQRIASMAGIGGGVLLQIAATLTIAWLLELPAVSLAGGILLALIAIRLLKENASSQDTAIHYLSGRGLYHSIMTVTVVYLLMCPDNIVAIAAVSRGAPEILVLGLLLSGGLLVAVSLPIADLMTRYPVTFAIGAGILGWTAGSMIAAAPAHINQIPHPQINQFLIPVLVTAAVTTSPWWWRLGDKLRRPANPRQIF